MPNRSNPTSLANLRQNGRPPGIPNKATRDLKAVLDKRFFKNARYWRGLMKRINAGEAPQQECLLIQLRYGRPRTVDEDDMPFAPASGDSGPQIIFNVPRPPAELEGRITVVGAIQMETSK